MTLALLICDKSRLMAIRERPFHPASYILPHCLRFPHGPAGGVRRQSATTRNAKGVSQDELAHEANASRSYLSQLEKGAFYARLKGGGRLSEALGVEPA